MRDRHSIISSYFIVDEYLGTIFFRLSKKCRKKIIYEPAGIDTGCSTAGTWTYIPVSRTPTITSSPNFKCIWDDCSICMCRLRPMKSQLRVVWSSSILLLNTDMTPSVSACNDHEVSRKCTSIMNWTTRGTCVHFLTTSNGCSLPDKVEACVELSSAAKPENPQL